MKAKMLDAPRKSYSVARLVSGDLVCSRNYYIDGSQWWEISYRPHNNPPPLQKFWCFTLVPEDGGIKLTHNSSMGSMREQYAFDNLDEAIAAAVSMFVSEDRERAFMEIPF